MNASTRLSMNGKSPMISHAPPFVPSSSSGRALRLSKDERRVFQQNQESSLSPFSSISSAVAHMHIRELAKNGIHHEDHEGHKEGRVLNLPLVYSFCALCVLCG
jgi:hypothetical protein